MQIVRDIGGYSMGRSDLVRRAMSKKKIDVMKKERENFVNGILDEDGNIVVKGAIRNGVSRKVAEDIFDQMMDFASYAFNKSHAAAYAVVAYQTAWLKYHYPVEFMAAMMNSFIGSADKISYYVHECKSMNIRVLPPDLNLSSTGFAVQQGAIRFGLAAIKNVGVGAVEAVVAERKRKGPFSGFRDFCERMCEGEVNKRCIESMIKCGVFDSFGICRSKLMAAFEKLIDGLIQVKKKNLEGQLSLFDIAAGSEKKQVEDDNYPDLEEFPQKKLLSMEKEMLGLYLSGHPLGEYEKALESQVSIYSKDLKTDLHDEVSEAAAAEAPVSDGMKVVVGGIITGRKSKTTKSNNLMAFIELEDLFGTMEVIVFPSVLEKYNELLAEENIVLITGRISMKEEEDPKIICSEVKPLIKNTNPISRQPKLYLKIQGNESPEFLSSLHSLLKYFGGKTPVWLYRSADEKYVSLGKEFGADLASPELMNELTERLGRDNVIAK